MAAARKRFSCGICAHQHGLPLCEECGRYEAEESAVGASLQRQVAEARARLAQAQERKESAKARATTALQRRQAAHATAARVSRARLAKRELERRIGAALEGLQLEQEQAREAEEEERRRRTAVEERMARVQAYLAKVRRNAPARRRLRESALEEARTALMAARQEAVRRLLSLLPIEEDASAAPEPCLLLAGVLLLPRSGDYQHMVDAGQDNVLAAALGLLAHLTNELARYLDVCLPHRLLPRGSHSIAVDEASGREFPLYPAGRKRLAEFVTALRMLNSNVYCLCATQGLDVHGCQMQAGQNVLRLVGLPRLGWPGPVEELQPPADDQGRATGAYGGRLRERETSSEAQVPVLRIDSPVPGAGQEAAKSPSHAPALGSAVPGTSLRFTPEDIRYIAALQARARPAVPPGGGLEWPAGAPPVELARKEHKGEGEEGALDDEWVTIG